MSKSIISNMWSFWEKKSFVNKTDVVVVGSGIVGLNAAIEIKKQKPQYSVLILEAGALPSGASTKNAGFACFGSPSELLMDLETQEEAEVFGLLEKRLQGLNLLRNIVGDENMNYETPGSYELFSSGDKNFLQVKERLSFLNDLCHKSIGFTPYSIDCDIIDSNGFNGFSSAIKINGEGQIDTGMMMNNLLSIAGDLGIKILNGIKVSSYLKSTRGIELLSDKGSINCNQCLIATNGFAQELIDKKVEPARAQVLMTSEIENIPFRGTYHFDSGYYYFRNVGNRVLFGGGRNLDFETENTYINELNDGIQSHLKTLLKEQILPNHTFEIEHQWTGIMGVGGHKSPYIEKLEDGVYCAVKLGGMGIAIGSTTGVEAAHLLLQS